MQKNILLVEDDKKLGELIKNFLEKQGFKVSLEKRGDKAIHRILNESPDLVILDLMLPGLDGLQICKTVRASFSGFILMLTAREDADDHVTGLEYGADDYLNKPIEPKILLAHIQKLLNRSLQNIATKQLEFDQLNINLQKHTVTLNEKNIELKPKEFELLVLLAENAGHILNRNNIMRSLRGIDYDGFDRSIDLRISYLRKKLNDNIENPYRIITVHGKGYLFVPDAWDH